MTPRDLLTNYPSFPTNGGGGRIRTFEGVSRQIYSLLPLAAWVPLPEKRAAYSRYHPPGCQRDWRDFCCVCSQVRSVFPGATSPHTSYIEVQRPKTGSRAPGSPISTISFPGRVLC